LNLSEDFCRYLIREIRAIRGSLNRDGKTYDARTFTESQSAFGFAREIESKIKTAASFERKETRETSLHPAGEVVR
jgi:hypothetical protein